MPKRPAESHVIRSVPPSALDPQLQRRVVIESVHPEIDCGRFPIKRTVGEDVVVSADVHADGHDVVVAALLSRRAGEERWAEVAMEHVGNDRWRGHFTAAELGEY